jgi:lysine-N-methylase
MAWPVRSLPVFQNWDCHSCTHCCRDYYVFVTDEERQRITSQGWDTDADIGDLPLFVRHGRWWRRRYRLNQTTDGKCVFLNDDGRCRIHARFGGEAKPLACRLYPFMLVPAGDHWRVSLRYACPSAAANDGRPLTEYQQELMRYGAEPVQQPASDGSLSGPPRLQGWQRVDWPDLFLFVRALSSLLKNTDDRIERRLRKCLALATLCGQARFEKVQGARLAEFVNLLGETIEAEVPVAAAELPPPGWVGRVLFRQILAPYARKDIGQDRGLAARGRLALFGAACRFAWGSGTVPRVHGLLPETTFERLEQPAGPLPAESEQQLERYYRVKVNSLQFCGPTNFRFSFWDGLESLALTFPVILWLSRAFSNLPREAAVTLALRIVDDNFGFNPLLDGRRQRWVVSILARRGELGRLIAWYTR